MKKRCLLMTLCVLGWGSLAEGSLIGLDHAGNYSAWTNHSNGGTGFQPWTFQNTGSGSEFLGDSSLGLNGNAALNTSGRSLGLSAGSGESAMAYRFFDGGSLGLHQKFEIQLGVNYLLAGSKGFDLLDASSNSLYNFTFSYTPFPFPEALYYCNGQNLMWSAQPDSIMTISFTRTNDLAYWVSIMRNNGDSWSGSVALASEGAGFRLNCNNTGTGSDRNLYANNMSLSSIPEPGTVALLGLGLLFTFRKSRAHLRF
ncbi:MAG: PEP-CTERM sorting domain-containing protein [Candidatus Firestonebacteria bacterium]|nr:PEP-CTERM sorting domain-containing protein [Candidatus Firestonebacteria bacterium]